MAQLTGFEPAYVPLGRVCLSARLQLLGALLPICTVLSGLRNQYVAVYTCRAWYGVQDSNPR